MAAVRGELVGREDELGVLTRFVANVPDGPTGLRLEGEAGIGKTALWHACVEDVRERLYWVLSCRAVEAEAKLGFSALGDLLADVHDEALSSLPEPQRRAMDVALLRADAGDRPVDARAVSLAFLGVVRSLAALAPVVLALDDLHWLDPPSARAIAFALRRLEHEPVGVIATVRDSKSARVDLESVLPTVERLHVPPLAPDKVHAFLTARLGTTFAPPTLHRLHRVSGGNAFFLLELARALHAAGRMSDPEALPIPDRLTDLLRARLAELDDATREGLLAAAALADPSPRLIAATLPRRRGIGRILDQAARSGVIVYEGDEIRFTHPLLASVLYADAPLPARRRVHAKLAHAVDDLEVRAKHLALAADEPDEEIADTLERAARRAWARGALEEAGALEEHAWRLTPAHLEDVKCGRAVESARHHYFAGDRSQAQRVLDEAISATPPGPPRAHALHLLGRVRESESADDGRRLQAQARAEAGDDYRLRIGIEKNLFHSAVGALDILSAEQHANAELALARRVADRDLLAVALADAARAAFLRGNADSWRLIRLAMELEPLATNVWVAAQPSGALATMQLYADDLESARTLFRAVLERARERGDVSAMANILVPLSTVERLAGDYKAAASLLHEANDIAHQSGRDGLRMSCLARRALVDAHTGRVDAARRHVDEAVGLSARVGMDPPDEVAHVRGFVALSLGEPAEAAAELAPLVARFADGGVEEPGCFRFLPDLVEALVAIGELEQARGLVSEHEARSRRVDRGWGLATAARCRALVAAAHGDLEAGLGAADEALAEHARVPMPFERARTLLVKGVIERRAKHRRASRASLEQALALFDELGTPLWSAKAGAELVRIGGRRAGGDELTATEQRVAALVAEGRTNREVAETLFMSVKTVEANLARVYRKLGVRSRTQLANKLVSGGSASGKP